VYIADSGANSVTWINNSSLEAGPAIQVGAEPFPMTFDRSNGEIYVISTNWNGGSQGGTLYAISDRLHAVTADWPVGGGAAPQTLAVDERTGVVFVVSTPYSGGCTCYQNTTLEAISGSNNSVIWTTVIRDGGLGLAVDSQNGEVYVLSGGSHGNITVVKENDGAIVATIKTQSFPDAAVLDEKTGNLYVENQGSDNVSIIATSTNTVVAIDQMPGEPTTMTIDSLTGNVFVGSTHSNQSRNPQFYSGTVTMIHGSTGQVASSYVFGNDFQGVVGATSTGEVVCLTYGNLTIINSTTNRPLERVPIDDNGDSYEVAYNSLNGHVYVTNWVPGTVSVLSNIPTPGTSSSGVPVFGTPAGAYYAVAATLAGCFTVVVTIWVLRHRSLD
jgi:YVTN family beta-propeller protein